MSDLPAMLTIISAPFAFTALTWVAANASIRRENRS